MRKPKITRDREIANLNIATFAAYEALYGKAPLEMVQFIHDRMKRLDYTLEPETYIYRARQYATLYLGILHQKAEAAEAAEKSQNSANTSGPDAKAQQGGESRKTDTAPRASKAAK